MNEELFTGKADYYDKYRPKYAEQAIKLLKKELLKDDIAADIGAGTGILTRQLIDSGIKVIAVEPNPDMREKLLKNAPETEIIGAPAENTGIKEHSIKLVTAGTAAHWFDPDKFREECRRILTPDGKAALLWNNEDKSNEFVKKLKNIGSDFLKNYGERPDKKEEGFETIFYAEYENYTFANDLKLNFEEFIGNRLSRSYAPKPGDSGYEEFTEALKAFFEENSVGGTITIPNITQCYIGTV